MYNCLFLILIKYSLDFLQTCWLDLYQLMVLVIFYVLFIVAHKLITPQDKANKISSIFLGSTVQKEKSSFYITPIRENKKFVFFSVILFSDSTAKKIAKIIDGQVDYILVDTEKKVQTNFKISRLINIGY